MPRNNVSREVRNHLLKAFEYIMFNSDFASLHGDQYKSVSFAYDKLKNTKDDRNWRIEIPQFEVPIKDHKLHSHSPAFLIGGIIQAENGTPTYLSFSLSIVFTTKTHSVGSGRVVNATSCCLPNYLNKKRIVRRFHFDFQPTNTPSSHIQYGGKFSESGYLTDCHYCLEHFLEDPHIHYPPMDLVLLLDLTIREFETCLQKWRQETNWRSLVLESQNLWWKEYWNRWAHYINNPEKGTFHQRIYSDG